MHSVFINQRTEAGLPTNHGTMEVNDTFPKLMQPVTAAARNGVFGCAALRCVGGGGMASESSSRSETLIRRARDATLKDR